MTTDQFYLTLPSNTNKGDTQAQYRIDLPQNIELKGEWEAGLAEFTYPNTWRNVGSWDIEKETECSFYSQVGEDIRNVFHITPGRYESVAALTANIVAGYEAKAAQLHQEALLDDALFDNDPKKLREKFRQRVLNNDAGLQAWDDDRNAEAWRPRGKHDPRSAEILEERIQMLYDKFGDNQHIKKTMPGALEFTFDGATQRGRLRLFDANLISLDLPKHVDYILGGFEGGKTLTASVGGYDKVRFKTRGKEWTAFTTAHPPDLSGGVQTLYVYSNIIKPSIVGASMVRLLRTVTAKGKFRAVVTKIFDAPHYHPLEHNSINAIEINVKDHLGEPVLFAHGTVIVKLHLRRRRAFPL